MRRLTEHDMPALIWISVIFLRSCRRNTTTDGLDDESYHVYCDENQSICCSFQNQNQRRVEQVKGEERGHTPIRRQTAVLRSCPLDDGAEDDKVCSGEEGRGDDRRAACNGE